MSFRHETSRAQRWPTMQAEHDLLVKMVQETGYGALEYLDQRCADDERQAVVYLTQGLGSGHGKAFTLVHDRFILWAFIWNTSFDSEYRGGRIGRVLIAPEWSQRRDELLAWLLEAVAVNENHWHPHRLIHGPVRFDTRHVTWEVTTRKTGSTAVHQPEPFRW